GMMVDSSIVILENIYSYRQRGHSLFDSATKGAAELTPAVIASTTTTLVVFLPIVYVEGIASDIFTPLALTVSFSLLASLVVAVTLVPMLSSKLLTKAMEDGRRYWFDTFLEKVNNVYAKALEKVLKFRKTSIFATILMIIVSLALIPFIGAEFMPAGDQGQLEVKVETRPGSSLAHTESIIEQVNDAIDEFEEIVDVNFVTAGGGDFATGNTSSDEASFTMQLVPAKERDMSTAKFVQTLDEKLANIAGAEITVSEMDAGIGMGDPIQINLNGPEHEVLRELADDIATGIQDIDGVFNPESEAALGVPQLQLEVDKEKAALHGLTVDDIQSQIDMRFIGQIVTIYREEGREIDVTLSYPEDTRSTINDLEDMKVQTNEGEVIPLIELAKFEETQGAVTLIRQNQEAQMNVSSDIMDRDLNSVVRDIEKYLDASSFPEG